MRSSSKRGVLRWAALVFILGGFLWLPSMYVGLALLVLSWFL